MIAVTTSGPLFEGTLDVRGGLRVGTERATARAAEIALTHLRQRARYATPKYGHVVDAVRTQVGTKLGKETLPADTIGGRVFLGGQSAFLGPILEGGTGPLAGRQRTHVIPRLRAVGTGRRGRLVRGRGRYGTILRFTMGGALMFRRTVNHPGIRAYRWASQSQAAINQQAPAIFERAMAEALKA